MLFLTSFGIALFVVVCSILVKSVGVGIALYVCERKYFSFFESIGNGFSIIFGLFFNNEYKSSYLATTGIVLFAWLVVYTDMATKLQ